MVIDSAIPIGPGQRQLIVGDRNVGKTALALDIVCVQRPGDIVCVYVVIGQPISYPSRPNIPTANGRRTRYVSSGHFASAAVREFLYITLYALLLDALVSEHGARLIATQAAEKWLDERSTSMERQLMGIRREASTQEMIEIIAGAGARERTA